ncbi:MAG: heavy metal translocating P-type ATPase, partial [Pseudorhodobacter sp.]|nr:heavy metal translocating P-type ATPase [Frankiaceae bacterium]
MGRVIQARAHVEELFLSITTMLIVAGGAAWVADGRRLADVLWIVATCLGLALSTWRTAVAVRRRRPRVDVIALLALVRALVVREPLS